MMVFSRPYKILLYLYFHAALITSFPTGPFSSLQVTPLQKRADDINEVIAIGDSYATGVGAGDRLEYGRCLRFSEAYPQQMSRGSRIPGDPAHRKLTNAACSGAKIEDVLEKQFADSDSEERLWGKRPAFGKPQIAVLHVGGDNIAFPDLVRFCILELYLRGGPEVCQDRIKKSWDLLDSPDLANGIDKLIKKTVEKGRAGFEQCSTVSWNWRGNTAGGVNKITKELRKTFNDMSTVLNTAVLDAVTRNSDKNVYIVDWQHPGGEDLLRNHRYCEEGVIEPDENREDTWFFHYPYGKKEDPPFQNFVEDAIELTVSPSFSPESGDPASMAGFVDAMIEIASPDDDPNAQNVWDTIGNHVKMFHPTITLHTLIWDRIFEEYQKTVPSEPVLKCNGVSGDYWVVEQSVAADNVEEFCGQNSPSVEYNKDTNNHLQLSVSGKNLNPSDDPDCRDAFMQVLEKCDSDPINNPHNYKFGGSYGTSDHSTYIMKPLYQQVNDFSCDVTWKVVLNSFNVRGKNFPDARLGPDGDLLRHEISGCGLLKNWKFEWTRNNGADFQWHASGTLPIGTKACLGRAIKSAGGNPSHGGCGGSG